MSVIEVWFSMDDKYEITDNEIVTLVAIELQKVSQKGVKIYGYT